MMSLNFVISNESAPMTALFKPATAKLQDELNLFSYSDLWHTEGKPRLSVSQTSGVLTTFKHHLHRGLKISLKQQKELS